MLSKDSETEFEHDEIDDRSVFIRKKGEIRENDIDFDKDGEGERRESYFEFGRNSSTLEKKIDAFARQDSVSSDGTEMDLKRDERFSSVFSNIDDKKFLQGSSDQKYRVESTTEFILASKSESKGGQSARESGINFSEHKSSTSTLDEFEEEEKIHDSKVPSFLDTMREK